MENIPNFFLTQGPFGVIIVVLGIVVMRIYGELKEERKKNETLQEARRLDAVEVRTDVTSVLPGISQSLKNISDKIEISKARGR